MQKKKVKMDLYWIFKISFIGFLISLVFSLISERTIPLVNPVFGIMIVVLFVFVGVLFDMIGVAITSASIAPFNSMNSKRVRGANVAIKLLHNAEKASSFCNDVIGDICGIISGSGSVIIAISLASFYNYDIFITTLISTSLVAALTIGGKAIGKSLAINNSNAIVYDFALIISIFYRVKK